MDWHDAWQQRLFVAHVLGRPPPVPTRRDAPGCLNAVRRTERVKPFLLRLQRGLCIWCGVKMAGKRRATMEHLVPRARGGSDRLYNIALACKPCNHRRGCACCFAP